MAKPRHLVSPALSPIIALALLGLLGMAAMPAAADNMPKSPAAPMAAAAAGGVPNAFAGAWFVGGVFPTGMRQANPGDPHLGAVVVVKADDVSDVNGRRCAAPHFEHKQIKTEAAALGFTGSADQLQIDCDGQPFATLLLMPGKALAAGDRHGGSGLLAGGAPVLLARRPEALYLLERAEQALYRQATLGAAVATGGVPSEPAAAAPLVAQSAKPEVAQSAKPEAAQPAKPEAAQPAKPEAARKKVAQLPSKSPAKSTVKSTAKSGEKPVMKTAEQTTKTGTKPTTKTAMAVKSTAKVKAPAPVKALAGNAAPQDKTTGTQKLQANAVPKKTATQPAGTTAKPVVAAAATANKKTVPVSGKPAVPDVALLQSDVSGAKPVQAKPVQVKPVQAKPAQDKSLQGKVAAAQATKTAPKPGMAIQLASYPGIGAAAAGWQSLHSTYPELTTLKPLYVAADNAPIVHLYATGAAADKLRQICGDLQSKQAYCTISQ
jgi:hypothetical protein